MKRMKRWGLRRLGGKRGFTLIELLIVMVILAILAGIVIISVGGVIGRGQATAYDGAKEQVELGVTDYIARTFGDLPTLNCSILAGALNDQDGNAMTTLGPWFVVDMCSLTLSEGGVLKEIPVSAYGVAPTITTAGADCATGNCNTPAYPTCNCSTSNHYTWLLDTTTGDVFSVCSGADCDTEDEDGFQGIYP